MMTPQEKNNEVLDVFTADADKPTAQGKTFDVRLPNGMLLKGVPEGTTKAQLSEKLKAKGIGFGKSASENKPEDSALEDFGKSFAAGAARAPFFVGDLSRSIEEGLTRTAGEAYTAAGGELTPEQAKILTNPPSPIKTSEEVYKKMGVPLHEPKGAAGVAGELLGGGIGAAGEMKAAEKGVKTAEDLAVGWKAHSPEIMKTIEDNLKKEAAPIYKYARDNNAILHPQMSTALVNHIEKEATSGGRLDKSLHGETMQVLSDMKKQAAKGLDLESLDIYRRRLRNIASRGSEEDKANKAMDALIGSLETLETKGGSAKASKTINAWNRARAQWSKAMKYETVADILSKAEGNPDKIKRDLTKLLKSDKIKGWTKAEKDALKEAAENTTGEKLLRMAGKFGFDLGGSLTSGRSVLPGLELLGGFQYHVPGYLPAVAGATGARYAQTLLGRAKAQKLLDAIQKGKLPSGATPNEETVRAIGGY